MSKLGDLNHLPGSFVSAKQQEEMHKTVAQGGGRFQDMLKNQAAQREGVAPPPAPESGHAEPNLDQDLLSDDDVFGDDRQEIDASEQGIRDRQKELQESHEEEFEDGTRICKHCNSITFNPDLIPFTDDELLQYLFGGRILRRFVIEVGSKNFEFGLITLNQEEIDDCSTRVVSDVEAAEIISERDYQNRMGLYQLVYSIVDLNGTPLATAPQKNPTKEQIDAHFEEKRSKLFSFGHNIIVMMSEKQALLERSIRDNVTSKVRLKN